MRTTFILTIGVLLLSGSSKAQTTCRILTDSIIAGRNATEVDHYFYNASDQIIRVETTDSAQTVMSHYDTVYYNAGGYVVKVEHYNVGNPVQSHIVNITYDGSNRVVKVQESGFNGSPWAKAFDYAYYANGQLKEMVYDPLAEVGNPEGFNASFKNIGWTNGNASYVELEADFGMGPDILELNVSYDTKPNIEQKKYINEGPDVMMMLCVNNMMQLTFVNNEVMGPAGTVALEMIYTYNNGDVFTVDNPASLFESNARTRQFELANCSGVSDESLDMEEMSFSVYPNPFNNKLNINMEENETTQMSVLDIQGRIIYTESIDMGIHTIDLSNHPAGLYFIQLKNKESIKVQKVIKD